MILDRSFFYGIVSSIGIIFCMLFFEEYPLIHVIGMWGICFLCCCYAKYDLLSPLVWFSTSFTLYNTAYATIFCMGWYGYGYSIENILMPTVSLLTFLLGFSIVNCDNNVMKYDDLLSEVSVKKLVWFFGMISLICILHFMISGTIGKTEMKSEVDIYYRVGVYSIRYYTFFSLLYIGIMLKNNECDCFFDSILCGILPLLFTLFTGERDVIFRYFVIMVFVFFSFNKIKRHELVYYGIGCVFALIGSVYVKYYFLRGIINSRSEGEGLLYQFLSSDFSAAGRNLQILINSSWTEGYHGYTMLLTEILTPFLPSGLFVNPDSWYNNYVFLGNYTGNAFTLVGTGYIIGGLTGIVVLFFILGIFTRFLYARRNMNLCNLCIYVYMISAIILSFRQSLSSILTAYIRIVLIALLILYVVRKIKFKLFN